MPAAKMDVCGRKPIGPHGFVWLNEDSVHASGYSSSSLAAFASRRKEESSPVRRIYTFQKESERTTMTFSVSSDRVADGGSRAWVRITLAAIAANTKAFREHISPSCQMMAIVKADGYGHGAVQTAQAALRAGADRLGVAILEEALQLRSCGITEPILVLGYTPPQAVALAIRQRITLTFCSTDVLDAAHRETERLRLPLSLHLKVDTGMGRLGVVTPEAALALARQASSSPLVRLEGVFTHFADADGDDPAGTLEQFRRFEHCLAVLRDHGLMPPIAHCCNSAATMRFPGMHLDMVRVGIALYGLYPSSHTQLPNAALTPAMQLRARIAELRDCDASVLDPASVSFAPSMPSVPAVSVSSPEHTSLPQMPKRIAVVPVGSTDGLPPQITARGTAIVGGVRVPYAGPLGSDWAMLDVSEVPHARAGDEVVLMTAGDGGCAIDAGGVAAMAGTIHYELVCRLGSRLPRQYDDPIPPGHPC